MRKREKRKANPIWKNDMENGCEKGRWTQSTKGEMQSKEPSSGARMIGFAETVRHDFRMFNRADTQSRSMML